MPRGSEICTHKHPSDGRSTRTSRETAQSRGAPSRAALSALLVASGLALTSGCRGDAQEGPSSHPTNMMSPSGAPAATCPGEALSVCDLKLESSDLHPAQSDPVELHGVIVTTATMTVSKSPDGAVTLAGFYVQDVQSSEALNHEYSGILVVYRPSELGASAPAPNQLVDVTGTFETFGREGAEPQKQVKAVSITARGRGSVEPVEISDPSLVRTGGEKSKAYEGVLIKVREVSVTSTKLKPNGTDLFGAFEVTGGLIVSNAMFRYSMPAVSETFTSIAGILRIGTAPYDSGQSMLTPRFREDLVPKNAASVLTTIRDIQDPTSPGKALETCSSSGRQRMGTCAQAHLTNVVVTAVGAYVSRNLLGLYVQDDSVADGRFAGVKVVYNPAQAEFIPEPGMRVDIDGEVIEYYRGTQIQYPKITRHGTETKILEPVVVQAADVARTSSPETNPYEGVLVRVENAKVTEACVADMQGTDRGNWIVNGVVFIGSAFEYGYNGDRPMGVSCRTNEGETTGLCSCEAHSRPNDQRQIGDEFTSISGIGDFAFDEFQIQPRGDADIIR